MPIRAVIIAVEHYPNMSAAGLAKQLEGSIDDANKFRDWLIAQKKVDPANIVLCTDATHDQISNAFRKLVDQGQDSTEELYVFYSGHGFTFTDSVLKQRPADV